MSNTVRRVVFFPSKQTLYFNVTYYILQTVACREMLKDNVFIKKVADYKIVIIY